MWLNSLLGSGDGLGAVISESAFAADVDCSEFPHINKIEVLIHPHQRESLKVLR